MCIRDRATIEPVIAVMVSVFYYKEPLSIEALIGIVLILGAVVILAIQKDGVPTKAEHQEVQAAK